MATEKLSERSLKRLQPGSTIWDGEVRGLGARKRRAEGDVTFIFKYRSPIERDLTGRGKQRLMTIGRWGRGDWGIDDARKQATAYRDAVRLHRDPAVTRDGEKEMMSVSELCDRYLAAVPTLLLRGAGRPKKDSTLVSDRGRIERHIKPLIGTMPVDRVQPSHIETMMHQIATGATAKRERLGLRAISNVRGGKGVASRTLGLLGAIFGYAIKIRLRTDNPVHGVVRFADRKRERRLTDEEYRVLGGGLTKAAGADISPIGIGAIRLLLLTGWRRNEATELRWTDLDLPRRTARLGDTKTGQSVRPLSGAALQGYRGR